MKAITLSASERIKQFFEGKILLQFVLLTLTTFGLLYLLNSYFDFNILNLILLLLLVTALLVIIFLNGIKPNDISMVDAVLQCKTCANEEHVIHVGEEAIECPKCKKLTRWRVKEFLQAPMKRKELLQNLALFARHNPQPLIRISSNGKLTGANIAAESLFGKHELYEHSVLEFLPQLKNLNIKSIIQNEESILEVIKIGSRYFNMIFKGVKSLNSMHIYCSEVTDIKYAEIKIKQQSEEIKASIKYASYIQHSMLPHQDQIDKMFVSNMIVYQPKDTVSGDFYWVKETGDYKIVVVADCTGHGVPGAMVSMRAISMLNDVVMRDMKNCPANILNMLRERWIEVSSGSTSFNDGMDMAVAVVEKQSNRLIYAGANNPMYIVSEGEIVTLKADRMPIGRHLNQEVPFTKQYYQLKTGDRLFLFSDGYKDQFGGELNKKFSAKKFKELLLTTSALKMDEQKRELESVFVDWKGRNEQVDDVLVMGVEIN